MGRQPSTYERTKWLRRAETLHRKASELLGDMLEVTGAEHAVTDYADAVVERCEELTSVLSKPALEMWSATA